MDFTEEYIKSIEQRVNQIEFVNRLSEVQYITGTFCPPYLLISSPMEYGKTRLIEAVKVQMQKQNWYCINIELSRKESYSVEGLVNKILQQLGEEQADDLQVKTPEKYGAEIGIRILSVLKNTEKNVLILVDESESVNDDLAKQFLNQFILVLKEVLSISGNIQLRLILAGRYISNWTQLGLKIPLKAYPLTPFDFSAIHQT
ncbi:MAG: ATP-binding protein, partial [bacterium]|nr:ATP-binding protein [bacterium]